MPKLGTTVVTRSAPPSSGIFTSTDQAFLVGLADQGLANTPVVCQSVQDYQTNFGARSTTNITLFDSVDVFFREGGNQAVVSRVVGPSPVNSTVTLDDDTAAPTLLVTAKYPGAYSVGYQVTVTTTGGSYAITISDANGNLLESNSGLVARADAINATWGTVVITATGSSTLPPATTGILAPTTLAVGAATSGGTLAASTAYFYVVTAVNAEGETIASNEATASTGPSNKTLPLTWTLSAGAVTYNVYRGLTSGSEVSYASVTAPTVAYTDAGSGTVGTALPPTVNTTGIQKLASGTDNRSSITGNTAIGTAWGNALAGFRGNLGAGQVAAPGQNNSTVWGLLLNHAGQYNRAAVLDLGTGASEAALAAQMGQIAGLENISYGAAFAGNLYAPYIGTTTVRSIPASAVVCALCARGDGTGSPNVAPAGLPYPLIFCTGTDTDLDDGDRQSLFNAGGNTFHYNYGILALYGFQTPVSSTVDDVFDQFNHTRTRMAIVALAQLVAANYQFSNIDGKGTVFTALQGDLSAMLSGLWTVGALYGDTAADAFSINVGSSVNTPTTIANQEVLAVATVCMSPYASYVEIDLVTVPVNQSVSG